jgi:hypothetical protein
MIIYDLACNQQHSFEGWFQSLAAYDSQREKGLISCPQCGSNEVHRIPSALHLGSRSSNPVASDEARPVAPTTTVAAFQQLVSAIVAKCEDVGSDFAQEARKIHYMEAPLRSIRGTASDDDYEGLREEGIEVLRLPILKKEDLN